MLYELNLNNKYNDECIYYFTNVNIIKTINQNIINEDFYDKLLSISNLLNDSVDKYNMNILNPYYYLKKITMKPIYFFIFKEICSKFSLELNNSLVFSNSIENINGINKIINNIKVCTKNKLYSSSKKRVIHNYSSFMNNEKNNCYNTIIVNYDDYNSFIKCILISLVVQRQNGTLIINVPSVTTNIILSLINFIMKFYNITIIKPFATPLHSTERYIICEKYKTKDNKIILSFVRKCLDKINQYNYDEFIINNSKIDYFYLKQIIHDNSIWGTYVLNVLNKFLVDDNIVNSHKENYSTVSKWLQLLP